MNWTREQIDSTLRKIVERSLRDREFRALALSDARAAVNAVSAAPLPESFKVAFVDNAGADMTVVLPDPPARSAIDEAELAGVAGGANNSGYTFTCRCHTDNCGTQSNLTACNPGYTKKPGNANFCP